MSRQLVSVDEAERLRERGSEKMVVFLRFAPGDYTYLPLLPGRSRRPKRTKRGQYPDEVWVHDTLVDALDTIRNYGAGLGGRDAQKQLFVRTLQGETLWQGWNPADFKYVTDVSQGEFRRRAARRFRRLRSTAATRDRSRRRR